MGVGLEGAGEFAAVHAGHHAVEEDEIGLKLAGDVGDLGGEVAGADFVALLLLEHQVHDVEEIEFIVDDEDAFFHMGPLR